VSAQGTLAEANPVQDIIGPIARRLLGILDETSRAKVLPLAPVREARQRYKAAAKTLPTRENLAGLDPAHALYVSMQHFVSLLCEGITALPELEPLTAPIRAAEDEYMPSGPPISPLTHSYFFCWAVFDAAYGKMRETLGTCLIAVAEHLGLQPQMLTLLRAMQESRMGLYVQTGGSGDFVVLRELLTGKLHRCHVASAYPGAEGQLWLARLFPPPAPGCAYDVIFTTPYIILEPGVGAWERYLRKAVRSIKSGDPAAAYKLLMKYGAGPNFWNEYILEAYVRHQFEAIFLAGLPEPLRREPRVHR
jgi:hypothetical protein